MTKPKPVVKEKIKGTIYVLPQTFLLNLSDGRYAKLTVALELAPGQSDGAAAGAGGSSSWRRQRRHAARGTARARNRDQRRDQPERRNARQRTSGRDAIKQKILHAIRKQTDVKVEAVLFPDLTVQ